MRPLLAVWLVASCIAAATEASATPTPTSTPWGHDQLCRLFPSECHADGQVTEESGPYALKEGGAALIRTVNNSVNGSIRPVADPCDSSSGICEFWNGLETTAGDCEEYVLAKRRALINAGLSPSQVLMVIVEEKDVIMKHLVLAVRTDQGVWILDNQTPVIWLLEDIEEKMSYAFLKRQRSDRPLEWTTDLL